MTISFTDFKRAYNEHKAEFDRAFESVMNSGQLILGKQVQEFEKEFAAFCGALTAVGVANGMEALQIALMALGIKDGDEVITTPFSAVATANAIVAVGAKPVFVDIDEYFNLDPAGIPAAITPKTKAILPVHLYGQPADMDAIMAVAKDKNLKVIEDCAQAHGAQYNGKSVGSFGDFGCFSFYPTKNLGAFGDSGAVVTRDQKADEVCRTLRNYGQKNRYEHEAYGINSRLDELQAALLLVQIKYLKQYNARRQEIARMYNEQLAGVKDIVLPKTRAGSEHVYHIYAIQSDWRDELQKYLSEQGITTLIHYPIIIPKQRSYADYNALSFPKAQRAADTTLSLPIHPLLTNEEVNYICEKIKQF